MKGWKMKTKSSKLIKAKRKNFNSPKSNKSGTWSPIWPVESLTYKVSTMQTSTSKMRITCFSKMQVPKKLTSKSTSKRNPKQADFYLTGRNIKKEWKSNYLLTQLKSNFSKSKQNTRSTKRKYCSHRYLQELLRKCRQTSNKKQ